MNPFIAPILGAAIALLCLALLILVSLLVSVNFPRWRHDLYVKPPTRAERRSATRAARKVSPPL